MGNRFATRAWLGVLLAAVVAVGVGFAAYNAGVAQGLAEGSRIAGTPGAVPPYVYMWPHPWGFGFGFFPFFFVLLCFFLVRRLLWAGGEWGHRYDGIPRRFEEWHRRAHERDAPPNASPGA